MNIYHLSDTHGQNFWNCSLAGIDVVIHSGDLIPDFDLGNPDINVMLQSAWLSSRAEDIVKWLDGRPILYVEGNHDFISLKDFMPAIKLNPAPVEINGIKFSGYREIPPIAGYFAGEADNATMTKIVQNTFSQPSDILVTHTPPHEILDGTNKNSRHPGWGCRILAARLKQPHSFRHHFFGHVHQIKPITLLVNNTFHHNGTREDIKNANGILGHRVSI